MRAYGPQGIGVVLSGLLNDGAAGLEAAEGGVLDVEHRVRAADGTSRWFHSRASPLAHGAGSDGIEWFGTSTDIHGIRELREHQAVLVAKLQHRTRNLIAVVRLVAEKTLAGSASLEESACTSATVSRRCRACRACCRAWRKASG